jgi:hypothetical protein
MDKRKRTSTATYHSVFRVDGFGFWEFRFKAILTRLFLFMQHSPTDFKKRVPCRKENWLELETKMIPREFYVRTSSTVSPNNKTDRFLIGVTNDGRTAIGGIPKGRASDQGSPRRSRNKRLQTMGQPKIIGTSPRKQQ